MKIRKLKKKFLIVLSLGILISLSYWAIEMNQIAGGVNEDAEMMNAHRSSSELQNGDILFQTSLSNQSKDIQAATGSKYSHMGIIYKSEGALFVYEAVQPVKLTKLKEWISRGENGHYVVKRLRNADELLTEEVLVKMKSIGDQFEGRNYDLYFEWNDERIYCSELVWKIYNQALGIEIGNLELLSDFNLESEKVRKKMKERYGENIPLNEKVISPGEMFDSELLVEVISN